MKNDRFWAISGRACGLAFPGKDKGLECLRIPALQFQ
jgi:hypothetical protein